MEAQRVLLGNPICSLKEAGCERIQVEACGKAFRRKVKAGGDNNYKNGGLEARYTGWMLRGQAKRCV